MDVEDLTRLYVTLFASEADPNCAVELVSVDPELQSCLDGVDLGVEEEISMSPQDLATDLGFSDGLPFLFNRIRHNSGFNPWDDPQLFEHASIFHDEEHTVPLKLHWHQLAGVRAVLRRVFEKEQRLTEPCTGVLIADEVGLGKTAMAIAIIAFLTHLVWLKSGDAQMPPIIRTFFNQSVAPSACILWGYLIYSAPPVSGRRGGDPHSTPPGGRPWNPVAPVGEGDQDVLPV